MNLDQLIAALARILRITQIGDEDAAPFAQTLLPDAERAAFHRCPNCAPDKLR